MKYLNLSKFAVAVAASALLTVAAPATLLNPSTSVALSGSHGPLGATLLASTNASFAGANSAFSGNLVSSVYSGDLANPLGGLTFAYLLSNNSDSTHAIGELNLSSFGLFQTSVGYTNVGVLPLYATRVGSSLIEFALKDSPPPPFGNFQDNLLPGQTTALLLIHTDAQYFDVGVANIINSTVATTTTFVPAIAVPEPTTISLGLLSLVALAATRKSRV